MRKTSFARYHFMTWELKVKSFRPAFITLRPIVFNVSVFKEMIMGDSLSSEAPDLNAAEQTGTIEEQDFIRIEVDTADLTLVVDAAKDGRNIALHIPGRRHDQFRSPEYICHIDRGP